MLQNHSESRPAPRRRAPTSQRFWFIALGGTIASSSYQIMPLLQGDFSVLQKMIVPAALLIWLYRGSEWARWLLMAVLLGFGIMNMYLGFALLDLPVSYWLKVYVFSSFMVATGLYLALAGKDFQHYRNYVTQRDGPRAAARQRAAEQARRQGAAR